MPMAQAPKAWTTRKVRRVASRPRVGASRMPDSAAKTDPMDQAVNRTRPGLSADRATSVGLSTTARMATPSRWRRKKAYRPKALTVARANEMTWA